MHPVVKNTIAIVAGVVVGSLVNMALVTVGPILIPVPAGVDMTTVDSYADSIGLLEPRHFLFPFLAHALGTLAGALLAYGIAANRKQLIAYAIGGFFLLGGIAASTMIPAPLWFVIVDLVFAYLPMAWLAGVAGQKLIAAKPVVP